MRPLRVKNRLKDLTTADLVDNRDDSVLRIAWREAYMRVHYGRRFRRVKDKNWYALHQTLGALEKALAEEDTR